MKIIFETYQGDVLTMRVLIHRVKDICTDIGSYNICNLTMGEGHFSIFEYPSLPKPVLCKKYMVANDSLLGGI
jgi:hypothetical protein